MSFSTSISGFVDHANAEAHKLIEEAFARFHAELAKIEGVKIETGHVQTPSGSSAVAATDPEPAAAAVVTGTESGATATVSGGDLTTGNDVHPNTPGSPPKGPK